MDAQLQVLLDDFNKYRNQTMNIRTGRVLGFIKEVGKVKGEAALGPMRDWCDARGVDPRRWLYWLFARTQFRFSPKLTQLVPAKQRKGESLLKAQKREAESLRKYSLLRNTPQLTSLIFQEIDQKRVDAGLNWDPNRDLTPLAEVMKSRRLSEGRPDLCLDAMFAQEAPTWGYHPKSKFCGQCPLASPCANRLQAAVPQFNIFALRTGQLSLQQAMVLDGRANHGR